MRALVIDDSRTVRAIIGKILREARAGGGRGRRTAARGWSSSAERPDVELVLVDWNMPEMNGLEFIQAVRADRAYDAVRIMMVTTETEQEQVMRALEAGANEYVMKPFTQGHPGRQAQPARRARGVSRAEDPRPGRGRRGRVPPAGGRRTRAPTRPSRSSGRRRTAGSRWPSCTQVNPDLVILDVEMPEMDGLATLPRDPQDAPEAAGHHVQRPDRARGGGHARRPGPRGDRLLHQADRAGGLDASLQVIREELIPEIKALCRPTGPRPRRRVAPRRRPAGPTAAADRGRRHRHLDRRAERAGRRVRRPAGRPAGAGPDRPAHAADVHAAAGRAADGPVRRSRSRKGAPAASCAPGTPGSRRATST